jgi:hypothetical protein
MEFLTIERSASTELGKILTDAFDANPAAAARAAQKGVEFMNRLVTRSMRSTGFELKTAITAALRQNAYGLPPLRRYSSDGAVMATTIRRFFHGGKSETPYRRYKTRKGAMDSHKSDERAPGSGFAGMMSYNVGGSGSGQYLKVGALTSAENGRAGAFWTDIFGEWQQEGETNVDYSGAQGPRGLHGFLAAIGMPIRASTILKRPARPIMQSVIERENPYNIFAEKFVAKLLK